VVQKLDAQDGAGLAEPSGMIAIPGQGAVRFWWVFLVRSGGIFVISRSEVRILSPAPIKSITYQADTTRTVEIL